MKLQILHVVLQYLLEFSNFNWDSLYRFNYFELGKSTEYKYVYYDKDNSILYHVVTEENCGTKESFIISMSNFITLIDKFKPRGLIIKFLKKPDIFGIELHSFMETTYYKLIR